MYTQKVISFKTLLSEGQRTHRRNYIRSTVLYVNHQSDQYKELTGLTANDFLSFKISENNAVKGSAGLRNIGGTTAWCCRTAVGVATEILGRTSLRQRGRERQRCLRSDAFNVAHWTTASQCSTDRPTDTAPCSDQRDTGRTTILSPSSTPIPHPYKLALNPLALQCSYTKKLMNSYES